MHPSTSNDSLGVAPALYTHMRYKWGLLGYTTHNRKRKGLAKTMSILINRHLYLVRVGWEAHPYADIEKISR